MIVLKIARSRRCGSSDNKLGMIGSVVRVMAAAVADVRPGEHALRQALKLVRANRSMLAFATTSRRRSDVVSGAPSQLLHDELDQCGVHLASVLKPLAQIDRSC